MRTLLSFVIPCYGSEKTISAVIREIIRTVKGNTSYDYEIITVNDCSPDNVLEVLKKEAEVNKRIKILDLARNMGKHAALMAGFSKAKGNIIVCVDDDYQSPVDRLWDLLMPLENGYDISLAKYGIKKQSKLKNFGSFINCKMTEILLGKPKDLQLSNFSAMKRFICDEIVRCKNPFPYVDGLFLRSTARITNVAMKDRERISGNSGYTFKKSLSLWLNGFTAFSVKPLRIATITGVVCAFIGFIFGIYTIIHKFLNPETQAGYSSLMATLLFIGGMIMVMLGLIGEYVGRIYISINNSPQYVIREAINIGGNEDEEELRYAEKI